MDGAARDDTAIDRFCRDQVDLPPTQRSYHSLVPLSAPAPGQQYAFQVDLDACSGCKVCVAACHSQNGLDDGEVWRSVGLLIGTQQPLQQHVTTACHHCVEPACMHGCPVLAYDKDVVTGIVRHLDDQCIGCQYCVLQCPYDAPKFNARLGIVRKCDMCQGRLAVGEAPACAAACPTEAITIAIVDKAAAAQAAFLPGAPDPRLTQPTTRYVSRRPLPDAVLPADANALRTEQPHLPLVVMLVLTQLSVGAFMVGELVTLWRADVLTGAAHTVHSVAALFFGLTALAASTLHLGRPSHAWRSFIGLRTSWLSREIIGFSVFAGLAALDALLCFAPASASISRLVRPLGQAVALTGLAAVFCSAMIYHATRRPLWRLGRSGLRFFLTSLVLGSAATLVIGAVVAAMTRAGSVADYCANGGALMARVLLLFGGGKLALELADLRFLRPSTSPALRHTARVTVGPLHRVALARFLAGGVGLVVLPGLCLLAGSHAPDTAALLATSIATFGLALAGELLERYLFFAAVQAPRMPGGPAS